MTSILDELGAKPSTSEERGLAQLKDTDLMIFSPGISTAGFAEIRMAKQNPNRKIIATTIDKKGLEFANKIIAQVGFGNQIETRDEDLRNGNYPDSYFDFIYARLVLHYLSFADLDQVLAKFYKSLKSDGRLFVIVKSQKNINTDDPNYKEHPETHLTSVSDRDENGVIAGAISRYFHTQDTIVSHLNKAGFQVVKVEEYAERLFRDFMRREVAPIEEHLIEVVANKTN